MCNIDSFSWVVIIAQKKQKEREQRVEQRAKEEAGNDDDRFVDRRDDRSVAFVIIF